SEWYRNDHKFATSDAYSQSSHQLGRHWERMPVTHSLRSRASSERSEESGEPTEEILPLRCRSGLRLTALRMTARTPLKSAHGKLYLQLSVSQVVRVPF